MGGTGSTPTSDIANTLVRARVTLNVYNVDGSAEIAFLNGVLRPLGTGIFHCGVEVLEGEWSFRGGRHEGTGVFRCEPGQCGNLRPRERLQLGTVVMRRGQVSSILEQMKQQWKCREYNIYRRNCGHFCDELCKRLGVGPLPGWVTNMAGAAAGLADMSEEMRSATAGLAKQVSSLFEARDEWSSAPEEPLRMGQVIHPPQGLAGSRAVLHREVIDTHPSHIRVVHGRPTLLTSREPVPEAVFADDCWPRVEGADGVVGCF
mmetsp:Transcript_688/g.1746  ORF Transcript_688/g.1746 Transcript_688/m.1746 type:complete len:261 (+) Transcript_688:58-840(+)